MCFEVHCFKKYVIANKVKSIEIIYGFISTIGDNFYTKAFVGTLKNSNLIRLENLSLQNAVR